MSLEKRSIQYGAVFGDWHIQRMLGSGSGGKSAVFEIYRDNKGWIEYNALKAVSLIEEQGDPEVFSPYRMREYSTAAQNHRKKAEQEVRLMEQLRGKTNIVDYLDHQFFEWRDETGFGVDLLIRMEKLSDLRNELKNGRAFSEEEIVRIGKDMCHALIICHKKNILHRDIKPENIFFNSDGDYKLGDFGISRIMSESASAMASTGIGTAAYSAPEQFAGAYDKRVDIYSLGLVLYEMANGNKLPFAQSSYVSQGEIQLRLSGAALPAPGGVSETLARVILKACAFKAEDRYSSAEELLRGLENLGEEDSYATAAVFPPSQPADPYETAPARDNEKPGIIGAGAGIYETAPATETTSLPKDHRDHTPGSGGRNNKAEGKKNLIKWIIPAALIIIILLLLWLLVSLLSKHEHVWQAATCTSPEVCADCGKERGSPMGHTWKDAACTAPQTCVDCGATTGTAPGHMWSEATCETPQKCFNCGQTNNIYAEHRWIPATIDAPETCEVCGIRRGEALKPEAVYINELNYTYKEGKLWTFGENIPNYYFHSNLTDDECYHDYTVPGHTIGPVFDYMHNQYKYGLFVDGPKSQDYSITYRLDGKYSTFTGYYCMSEDMLYNERRFEDKKYFIVKLDGVVKYTSKSISDGMNRQWFSIDVSGAQTMQIVYPKSRGPSRIATIFDGKLS